MIKMVILHVANLDSNKSAGPNINVPKNIIYGNKYAKVALYNLKNADIAIKLPENRYFSIREYRNIDDLPAPFNCPDIVIFQGMYEIKQVFVAKKLRKKGIPYIIIPRCSLTDSAQKNKRLKKKIANWLLFNKFIEKAKKIQFLTKNEYEESKKSFKFKDYYILGNGIELPEKKYKIKKREEYKIVFIARYNIYHKGLDLLLESINKNTKWFFSNNVTLNLYGIDSDNGLKYLNEYVNKNELKNIIKINKPVFDKEKETVLLDSDVFIHTSRLEGQPTAVIEAISYGIPIIVTPGTNIADIVKNNNLGYVSNLNSNDIFNCIKKAFLDKKNYNKISKNEIKFAKENFNWNKIIEESIKNYE